MLSLGYFLRCLVIVMMCFALNFKVQAENEQYNAPNRPLTIAINKTTYPYMFMNDEGQADGPQINWHRLPQGQLSSQCPSGDTISRSDEDVPSKIVNC